MNSDIFNLSHHAMTKANKALSDLNQRPDTEQDVYWRWLLHQNASALFTKVDPIGPSLADIQQFFTQLHP